MQCYSIDLPPVSMNNPGPLESILGQVACFPLHLLYSRDEVPGRWRFCSKTKGVFVFDN